MTTTIAYDYVYINNITGPLNGLPSFYSSTGPQGLMGSTGPQGLMGPTGPQGLMGSTGPQGLMGPTGSYGPALFNMEVGSGSPLITSSNSVILTNASQSIGQSETYNSTNSGLYFSADVVSGAPSFSPGTEYVVLGLQNFFGIIVGGDQINIWGPAGNLGTATLTPGSRFSIYLTPSTAYYYVNSELITTTSTDEYAGGQSLQLGTFAGYPAPPNDTIIDNISIFVTGMPGPQGPQGFQGLIGATGPQGAIGQGFVIFATTDSFNNLCTTNPTGSNLGEFVLVTGGALYLYAGSGVGNTGPTGCETEWIYSGDVTDESLLIGPTGAAGPQGFQGQAGATGTFSGSVTFTEGTSVSLTGTSADVVISNNSFFKFSAPTGGADLSGIDGGTSGRYIVIVNNSATNVSISFKSEDITSSASNRFVLPTNSVSIGQNRSATCIYVTDLTIDALSNQSRWILTSST